MIRDVPDEHFHKVRQTVRHASMDATYIYIFIMPCLSFSPAMCCPTDYSRERFPTPQIESQAGIEPHFWQNIYAKSLPLRTEVFFDKVQQLPEA